MQKILKIKISKRPEFLLLGIDLQKIEKANRTLVWYMIATARVTYAKYWKQRQIPKTTEWLSKLLVYAKMDKITRKLREQSKTQYKEDWLKLKLYLTRKWGTKNIPYFSFHKTH